MKGYINESDIDRVRESTDIVDVVKDYVPLKKKGINHVGLCPFHSEKTPSFTVSESKQFFHCFGCGEGGDAVTFIMKKENLDFPEAVRFLAGKAGITLEETTTASKKIIEKKTKRYEINRDAAKFFFSNLWESKKPLEYLRDRNITDRTIRQFGLGYALDSWDALYNHLKSKGHSDEDIEKLGLIGKRSKGNGYYDKFRNRIIFPIINTRGNVLGFGGRVLDASMPKYLNSRESDIFNKRYNLYGLNLLNKFSNKNKIILVEGYMDVIALFSEGINYSVASLGTALTERQSKLIKRYGKEVFIAYDSDDAGIKATDKAVEILNNQEIEPKIVVLDEFKDPDDFIKAKGLREFEKKIRNAYKYIDYKMYIYKGRYNIENIDEKIEFTVKIAEDIKKLKSPIEKDIYIDKISKEIDISKQAMEKEVFGKKKNKIQYKNQTSVNQNRISPQKMVLLSGDLIAEIDLIKLSLYDKEFYDIISEEISLEEFKNNTCKEIYRITKILYRKDDTIDKESILVQLKDLEDIDTNIVNDILKTKANFIPENIDKVIKDLIYKKKTSEVESRRDYVNNRIKELEVKKDKSPEERDEFLNLCIELIDLNKKLKINTTEDGR